MSLHVIYIILNRKSLILSILLINKMSIILGASKLILLFFFLIIMSFSEGKDVKKTKLRFICMLLLQ